MSRFVSIALVAALMGAMISAVHAQRIGANAQSAPQDSTAELVRLRLAVAALERRVEELEEQEITNLKEKSAEATEAAAQEARTARFEQRLASLENASKTAPTASGTSAQAADPEQPLTVVAPFIVKDRNGRPIMIVQEGGELKEAAGARGLSIYGRDATSRVLAHVGVLTGFEGGRVYVATASSRGPDIEIGYTKTLDNPSIALFQPEGTSEIARLDKDGFVLSNNTGHPIAEIRPREGRGRLLLSNATGSHMIDAGSTTDHRGYVLANPYRSSTELSGDPSVLRGGRTR